MQISCSRLPTVDQLIPSRQLGNFNWFIRLLFSYLQPFNIIRIYRITRWCEHYQQTIDCCRCLHCQKTSLPSICSFIAMISFYFVCAVSMALLIFLHAFSVCQFVFLSCFFLSVSLCLSPSLSFSVDHFSSYLLVCGLFSFPFSNYFFSLLFITTWVYLFLRAEHRSGLFIQDFQLQLTNYQ